MSDKAFRKKQRRHPGDEKEKKNSQRSGTARGEAAGPERGLGCWFLDGRGCKTTSHREKRERWRKPGSVLDRVSMLSSTPDAIGREKRAPRRALSRGGTPGAVALTSHPDSLSRRGRGVGTPRKGGTAPSTEPTDELVWSATFRKGSVLHLARRAWTLRRAPEGRGRGSPGSKRAREGTAALPSPPDTGGR